MNLDQALQACFLPSVLLTLTLSGATYVLSCSVIQVTWDSRSQPPHNECPQLIIPNTWELLATVHATYVALWHGTQCFPLHEAAQAHFYQRSVQLRYVHHEVSQWNGGLAFLQEIAEFDSAESKDSHGLDKLGARQ